MNDLTGKRIGFAITGSFCTFEAIIAPLKSLVDIGCLVYPIMSDHAYSFDTKFGKALYWREKIEAITKRDIKHTIVGVEPIGPGRTLDLVIVAPCTGNTLAKLANGITDTAVTMACKAHWRNNRPVLLAIFTNDGLGANLVNIGHLMARKNAYFVPFYQDDSVNKNNSLASDTSKVAVAASMALRGRQLHPVLVK